MDNTIRGQILKIRDTALTNMFEINSVQRIAYNLNMFELVCYLEDKSNRKEYGEFILYGDKDNEG